MDEKITKFVKALEQKLLGLPGKEIQDAVGYYEEYLNDALDMGKDLDEVIEDIGKVDVIAGKIRAEVSIIKAQQSPGLKNYGHALGNLFNVVTTPFSILFLSVFIVLSYGLVAILFAGAFVTLLGAVVIAAVLAYEAFTIPSRFFIEIIGTLGLGFFGAGIFCLIALAQYKLGRFFIRISTRLIRFMVNKPGGPLPIMNKNGTKGRGNFRRLIFAGLIFSFAGLVIFSISGIPVRYFTIFNSMKPENITLRVEQFDTENIKKISISAAHSHIKLENNEFDKIIFSYEQPDWLDYEMGVGASMLSFYEKSNGRLPLFELAALHESLTQLTISIPEGYCPDLFTIENRGGLVIIERFNKNIEVKTNTGSILLEGNDNVNIMAITGNGKIELDGVSVGRQTSRGIEFYKNKEAGKTISLESASGNIAIK